MMRIPLLQRRHFLKVSAATTAAAALGCAARSNTLADPTTSARLHTPLCDLLGIEYPILQSGMGGVAGSELAAAVSAAGGLGILGAAHLAPETVRTRIREVRSRTDKPFGVNLLLHSQLRPPLDTATIPDQVVRAVQTVLNRFRERLGIPAIWERPASRPDHIPGVIEVLIEERVPVFSIGLGNPPRALVDRFHAYGAKVIAMVATVEDAKVVAQSGVDVIVAQGHEAGGHRSSWKKPPSPQHAAIGTMTLVPEVIDAVRVPVVAAGGISNGKGVAAALTLGAQGVLVGTRFVATRESTAADFYKDALVERSGDATVVTDAFSGLYARVLRNTFTTEYDASGAPVLEGYVQTSAIRDIGLIASRTRNTEYFALWAGQGIGMIHDIPAAADVIRTLVAETRSALHDVAQRVQVSS